MFIKIFICIILALISAIIHSILCKWWNIKEHSKKEFVLFIMVSFIVIMIAFIMGF